MEKLNSLILRFNRQFNEFHADEIGWKISKSRIAGRGIIATRNFNPGDIVFIDHPMIIGPRSVPDQEPICVGCYESKNLKLCSKGCFLNVCSVQCENSQIHSFECEYLRKFAIKNENNNSSEIARVLAPLRCLTFDNVKKEIVNHLHKIDGAHQGLEVKLLKQISTHELLPQDERLMQTCCRALDANGYEIQLPNKTGSIRGLYPMASLMNHSCTPNTHHDFSKDYQMVIKAAKVIPVGTEITSTYAPLLMGTPARRHFLARSKHFECKCNRCKDPTEYQTYLSAFRCRNPSCDSFLLPNKPLNMYSKWSCQTCTYNLGADKVAILQNVIVQEISKLDLRFPNEIMQFVKCDRIVATTHHSIVQFKFLLLNIIGYADGYKWSELSEELLFFKKNICSELLEIAKKLQLGQCKISEICSSELEQVEEELKHRSGIEININIEVIKP